MESNGRLTDDGEEEVPVPDSGLDSPTVLLDAQSSSSGEIPADLVSIPSQEVVRRQKCVGRGNRGVSWGFTSVIGRRKEMEDAVAVVPGFMNRTCDKIGGCALESSNDDEREVTPVHFFGVYDGHGGSQVAKFCAQRMHEVVVEEWDREITDESEWRQSWESAFLSSFSRVDDEVATEAAASDMVGSTAVVVVLSGCQIIASNCGDSRAVLCRGTETISLTVDQKPDREDELERIERNDGKVINWNGARVFGVLAMSRAIDAPIESVGTLGLQKSEQITVPATSLSVLSGDRYLRPWIIPVPEVTFTARSKDDECLILASDGLWDVISNDEAGNVARRFLRRKLRSAADDGVPVAQAIADKLTELALGRNSSDNISIVVVDLKSKRTRPRRN